MTPRPRKATFAILSSLARALRAPVPMPICGSDCDGAAAASTAASR
jgi:hypothetical protein